MKKVKPQAWYYTTQAEVSTENSVIFTIHTIAVCEVYESLGELFNSLDVEEVEVSTFIDVIKMGRELSNKNRRGDARSLITNSEFLADLLLLASRETFSVEYDPDVNGTYLYYHDNNKIDGAYLSQEPGQLVPHPDYKDFIRRLKFV